MEEIFRRLFLKAPLIPNKSDIGPLEDFEEKKTSSGLKIGAGATQNCKNLHFASEAKTISHQSAKKKLLTIPGHHILQA